MSSQVIEGGLLCVLVSARLFDSALRRIKSIARARSKRVFDSARRARRQVIENKQEAVDYLTWTFYYRRLTQATPPPKSHTLCEGVGGAGGKGGGKYPAQVRQAGCRAQRRVWASGAACEPVSARACGGGEGGGCRTPATTT